MVWMTRLVFQPDNTTKTEHFLGPAWWLRKKPERNFTYPWMEWLEMKRYMTEATKADKKWKSPSEPMLMKRPLIAQLLTDPWWEDGSPREVCSMTIRVGLDQTQISVNDTDNEQSITTTAGSLDEALETLEEALGAGRNLWRKWGGFKKRK